MCDKRALMAIFDSGHRLTLPNGYWAEKSDDNHWEIGQGRMRLALHLKGSIPVGPGGSMDSQIKEFVEAMNAEKENQ